MLSISASVASVRDRLAQREDSFSSVACINSPGATVISGTTKDLAKIQAEITAQDVKTRTTMLSCVYRRDNGLRVLSSASKSLSETLGT